MKRYLFLLLWIGGLLFPIAWVGKLLPGLRTSLGPIVRPFISQEWVHIVAHTILFAGLALLCGVVLKLRPSFSSALLLMTIVLVLGIGQETLQLISRHDTFGGPEMFDIWVDMSGGLLGILIWQTLHRIRLHKFIV